MAAPRAEEAARDRHMALVRRMAAGIGHALGNMLIRPLAAASVMGDDAGPLTEAVDRLSRFSRLLQGHHEPGEGPAAIPLIVEGILTDLATARGHAIDVRVKVRGDGAPAAAPGTVRQTMAPVIAHATARSTNVTVEVVSTRVARNEANRHNLLEPGRYVRVGVIDTGPALSRDERVALFEPVWSGRGEDAIALYSAHRALLSAGGHVCVDSDAKRTTVRLWFAALSA